LLFLAMLGGVGAIYLCGVAYLALLIGGGPAIKLGLLPFLPADLTKAALAAALVAAGRRYPRRRS
ncbi:MAG: biotin transporter BioY, partial [Acetobacteraceae bacterium]